jgi:hypothetical protein
MTDKQESTVDKKEIKTSAAEKKEIKTSAPDKSNDKHISPLLTFSENTKFIFNITIAALLVVLFASLSSYKRMNYIAIVLFLIAFYISFTETTRLYKSTPKILSSPLRNTVLLSYALCFMFLALFLYLSFICFF